MRAFKFSKPKTPGFGISKDLYISVLAARATLPSILQVVNPKGEGGAVEGFGVPLAEGATKEDLSRPLARGVYAIASKDRKTVLRTRILSKEEAGFDPEAFARSELARTASSELLARVRATWVIVQLTFESHDAMVYPALEFLLRLARRFAELTDGTVADPVAQRYLLPEEIPMMKSGESAFSAADHVAIHHKEKEGGVAAYTLGMRKFSLPELEILGLERGLERISASFLLGVCQGVLTGRLLSPGDVVGSHDSPFEVATGGLDRGMWEGIPCFELLPPGIESSSETLREWALENLNV